MKLQNRLPTRFVGHVPRNAALADDSSHESKGTKMKKLLIIPLILLAAIAAVAVAVAMDDGAAVAEKTSETVKEKTLDLGDHSSQTITGKAWKALESKKYDEAVAYAKACIKTHGEEAIKMQKSLTEPVSTSDKDAVFKMWALNDVGTCYFIMGQAFEKQDKGAEAIKAYNKLVKTVPFAQCWDANGWFWKPADAAKKQLRMLEFDAIDSETTE